MKASKEKIAELESVLNSAASRLADVTGKKIFGCHALWAKGNVFAMVWKEGRIGVKFPEEKSFANKIALKGAAPWKAGKMTMSHWVFVPELIHGKPAELKKWLAESHKLCSVLPPKKK